MIKGTSTIHPLKTNVWALPLQPGLAGDALDQWHCSLGESKLCWHIAGGSQMCALLIQKHFPAPLQLGIQGTDCSSPHPYSSGVTKAGFPLCLAYIPPSWLEFKGSVREAQGRPELTAALTESEVLWLVMLLSPKENNQHFSSMHMEKAHKC